MAHLSTEVLLTVVGSRHSILGLELEMVKIIETTELIDGLISYRTELEKVDTSVSLGTRYQRYKDLLNGDSPHQTKDQASGSSSGK